MGYKNNRVEHLNLDEINGILKIEGYSYVEFKNISSSRAIKKSIFIKNKDKKYYIPAQNIFREDITKIAGDNKYNYDYSGFKAEIDLAFMDDMKPLVDGIWDIGILLNIYGEKFEFNLMYDEKLNQEISNDVMGEFGMINKINLSTKTKNVSITSKNVQAIRNKGIDLGVQTKENLRLKVKVGKKIFQLIYSFMKIFKVKQNRVTFLSDSRKDFTGNFEFIYKEIKEIGTYEIKEILKPSIHAKRTKKELLKYFYYIATSKYIFLDDYYPRIYDYKIRDEIEVIQLWHATGAFKTFGFSRLGKEGGPDPRSKNHRNYTKAIVSSKEIKAHYAEAFGISESKVLATGIPRTDIFFDEEYKNKVVARLYNNYPKLKGKKVMMFAPTFRGVGQNDAHYDFERLDINLLNEAFKEEYVFILKLHPFIKNKMEIPKKCEDFVLDLSNEREINDLLFITDLLITDYSSVCFEYSLLNKPMIFFAYDLEEYVESRDFYYDYETFVPGPIVRDMRELLEVIKTEGYELDKLDKFRNKFFDEFDGQSTKRVIEAILN